MRHDPDQLSLFAPSPEAPVHVGRGARHTEGLLLDRVDELLEEAVRDPAKLARPVLIVVPSRSLTEHLCARLVAPRKAAGPKGSPPGVGPRARAGLAVRTLFAVARDVLVAAGEPTPQGGRQALEILGRRLAAGHDPLARAVEGFRDGLGTVVAGVRDLLDAGFTDSHLPAIDEQLAALPTAGLAHREQVARARALARVAAGCAGAFRALGEQGFDGEAGAVGLPGAAYARAAELLAGDPGLLPVRAVLIHGYADATGVGLDLLQVLANGKNAEVFLDFPPDPAAAPAAVPGADEGDEGEKRASSGSPAPGGPSPGSRAAAALAASGWAFPARLTTRLTDRTPEALLTAAAKQARAEEGAAPPPPGAITLLEAPGLYAEAREVVARARVLLDGGAAPESIGIVAREIDPYRLPLLQAFQRLGVPFSGVGATGSPGAAERRLRAVSDLLRLGARVPVERWLSARAPAHGEAEGSPSPEGRGSAARDVDLKVGLRTLGAVHLSDAARLEVDETLVEGSLPLPVRRGGDADSGVEEEDLDAAGGPASGRPGRLARRRLSGAALLRALEQARELVEHLEGWPGGGLHGTPGARGGGGGPGAATPTGRAAMEDHVGHARALFTEILGWRMDRGMWLRGAGTAEARAALEVLGDLERELPPQLPLAGDEFALLLARGLDGAARCRLGGNGGGVQVVSVTESRARTFEHLFVMGLNRHVFPRKIEEDPLLPDPVRGALAAVLPDIPVKARGHDEERYLFAQLVSAAPRVTLSWRGTNDEGDPASPSPLVDRLRLARPDLEVVAVPHPLARPAARSSAGAPPAPPVHELPAHEPPAHELPAHELLTLAALHGGRSSFLRALPAALSASALPTAALGGAAGEAPVPKVSPEAARLARLRGAVLAELDPDRSTKEGIVTSRRLGPYLGLTGLSGHFLAGRLPAAGDSGAPEPPLWVTHLEGMAYCSWRAFLTRVLRLEPPPDPAGSIPALDHLLVGAVVHEVVEAVVRAARSGEAFPAALEEAESAWTGGDLTAALRGQPFAVAWPDPGELRALAARTAARVARREGVPLLGRALARRALVLLEVAAASGLGNGFQALGAELEGTTEVPASTYGPGGTLHFRVDLVEAGEDGGVLLTDLKTGKPLSEAKRPDTREGHLQDEARQGVRLQATAYARAAAAAGVPGAGRYLFLGRPDREVPERSFTAEPDDGILQAAFEHAVGVTRGAWRAGAFTPRLLEANLENEGPACRYCEVRQACLQGDSGATRRLAAWVERGREHGEARPLPAASLAVFRLRDKDAGMAPAGEGGDGREPWEGGS